jgi:hypothetical protein
MAKKEKYDVNSPDAKVITDRIIHGVFMTEGTMIAFPTCFPGVTVPVRADESRIKAMDITDDGIVYAGTSGKAAHLLVGMFHGVTGMVFDMGEAEGATETAAICCGKKRFLAAVNGPNGGRIVVRGLQRLPFDLIQEWDIEREPYEYIDIPESGERIVHAVSDWRGETAVGVTESAIFTVDFESGDIEIIGNAPGRGRIVSLSEDSIIGPDKDNSLWRYNPKERTLERNAISLPESFAGMEWHSWARFDAGAVVYTADLAGNIYSFREESGFGEPLARAPYTPVGPMAATFDGRIFGFAGDGMSRLFCFDPGSGSVIDIGVAVSTFERRRYGYSFGDAVTGRDGEIVFGEDDDLGHLWLYFPKIRKEADTWN